MLCDEVSEIRLPEVHGNAVKARSELWSDTYRPLNYTPLVRGQITGINGFKVTPD